VCNKTAGSTAHDMPSETQIYSVLGCGGRLLESSD
jgi:hypothetical protein